MGCVPLEYHRESSGFAVIFWALPTYHHLFYRTGHMSTDTHNQ